MEISDQIKALQWYEERQKEGWEFIGEDLEKGMVMMNKDGSKQIWIEKDGNNTIMTTVILGEEETKGGNN